MLEKIGKAKGTNDAEFQALWKRAEDHFELLDNIKKYMENYIRCASRPAVCFAPLSDAPLLAALTAMCMMEVKLSDDVALSFDPKHGMCVLSLSCFRFFCFCPPHRFGSGTSARCATRTPSGCSIWHAPSTTASSRTTFSACWRTICVRPVRNKAQRCDECERSLTCRAGTLKRRKNERDRRKVVRFGRDVAMNEGLKWANVQRIWTVTSRIISAKWTRATTQRVRCGLLWVSSDADCIAVRWACGVAIAPV